MAPEGGIQFTEMEDIIGDFEIPCDYASNFDCGPAAAHWVMVVKCGCGNYAQRLACGGCKNIWLSTEDAAECPKCSEVYAPARRAFDRIEWLK